MQKASVFLSFLCAVHCLAMPILAMLLASSATFHALEHPLVEFLLLMPIISMTLYSLYQKMQLALPIAHFFLPILGIIGVMVGGLVHLHWLMGASAFALAIWQWINKNHTATCVHTV